MQCAALWEELFWNQPSTLDTNERVGAGFGSIGTLFGSLCGFLHFSSLPSGVIRIKSSDECYGDTATGLNPRWQIYRHFLIAFFAEIGTPPQQR